MLSLSANVDILRNIEKRKNNALDSNKELQKNIFFFGGFDSAGFVRLARGLGRK
jgi:hypothetical protein